LQGHWSHSVGGANAPPAFGYWPYGAEMGACFTNTFGGKMVTPIVQKMSKFGIFALKMYETRQDKN